MERGENVLRGLDVVEGWGNIVRTEIQLSAMRKKSREFETAGTTIDAGGKSAAVLCPVADLRSSFQKRDSPVGSKVDEE